MLALELSGDVFGFFFKLEKSSLRTIEHIFIEIDICL